MKLTYEFDPHKAASNLQKHGVSFQEAMTIFGDPFAETFPDDLHSEEEERWITLGVSSSHRMLLVWHSESGNIVRIIGARHAESAERYEYEEHKSNL